jgi:hypothetical protein
MAPFASLCMLSSHGSGVLSLTEGQACWYSGHGVRRSHHAYGAIDELDCSVDAASHFTAWRGQRVRIGTQALRIAAIALAVGRHSHHPQPTRFSVPSRSSDGRSECAVGWLANTKRRRPELYERHGISAHHSRKAPLTLPTVLSIGSSGDRHNRRTGRNG